jgi:hypothetical protein
MSSDPLGIAPAERSTYCSIVGVSSMAASERRRKLHVRRTLLAVRKLVLNIVVLGASYSVASATPIPFTWDPSKAIPALAGSGSSFTADTIDGTNYLHGVIQANGSVAEEFIVRINGFEENGQRVPSAELNSSYGLYFTINGTGHGGIFNSLDIALVADPGNNDGSPSSTLSGVAFSNGTAGDFLLASGKLASVSLVLDAAGVRHARFIGNLAPALGQAAFFGNTPSQLEVSFTTPGANFVALPQPDGSSIQLVNGGIGQVDFVPEPMSLTLMGTGLLTVFLVCVKRLPRLA